MILNESYSFSDVRYQISSKMGLRMEPRDAGGMRSNAAPDMRQISYDVGLTFFGYPQKKLLNPGTVLVRLDFQGVFAPFTSVWWMRREVLDSLLLGTDPDAAAFRREWQHSAALPKASKGTRTLVVEIVLTQQVYAWVGPAIPLFHKRGGKEQVYLPNLARGLGPDHSDFARLARTYTVPAI